MTRMRTLVLFFAVAAVAAGVFATAPSAAPSCTVEWDGGGGDRLWSNALNWTGNATPTADDHACIGVLGTTDPVLVDTSATVKSVRSSQPVNVNSSLTVTATGVAEESTFTDMRLTGTLAGAGTAIVTGTLDWAGGTMQDGGTTRSTGTMIMDPGNYGYLTLQTGRRLETTGTGAWRAGYVSGSVDVVWEQSGTFDLRGETGYMYLAASGNYAKLHNTGTLVKSAGTGASQMAFALDNDGTVEAQSGELQFSTGTGSSGAFDAVDGARIGVVGGGVADPLQLGDGTTFEDIIIRSHTLEVPAGESIEGDDLELGGGALAGAGTVNVNGDFRWTGGTMSGSGVTEVATTGGVTLDPGNYAYVYLEDGRTLRNLGGGSWLSGYLQGGPDALWEQGGTFDARGVTGHWYSEQATPARLHILSGGKVVRTAGASNSRIDFALENDGATRVDAGELQFHGGSAGAVSSGDFGGTGTGMTSLDGGEFEIGTASFSGVQINGATADVGTGATWSGTKLTLAAGTLGGPGSTTASGTLLWKGGTMAGTGTTTVSGALDVDPGNYSYTFLDAGRTLRATGTGTWRSGYLRGQDGATFAVAGTWEANGQTGQFYREGDADNATAPPAFRVEPGGTLTKKDGTSESRIDFALEFDGTVTAQTGTLGFHGGGSGLSTGNLGGNGDDVGASLVAGDFAVGDASFSGGRITGGDVSVAARRRVERHRPGPQRGLARRRGRHDRDGHPALARRGDARHGHHDGLGHPDRRPRQLRLRPPVPRAHPAGGRRGHLQDRLHRRRPRRPPGGRRHLRRVRHDRLRVLRRRRAARRPSPRPRPPRRDPDQDRGRLGVALRLGAGVRRHRDRGLRRPRVSRRRRARNLHGHPGRGRHRPRRPRQR